MLLHMITSVGWVNYEYRDNCEIIHPNICLQHILPSGSENDLNLN